MAVAPGPVERPVLARRRFRLADAAFAALLGAAVLFALGCLGVLLYQVLSAGLGRLRLDFLPSYPSRKPEAAGIRAALIGSLWVMGLVAAIVFPIGIGAAIYLEEFAPRNRLTRLIEVNVANLAAVPSVVYGILGLALFVRFLGMGRSVFAAALTLSLLVLPVVIVASREALRAVPPAIREAGLAIGATRWQTVRSQVIPPALPGVMTGVILALSRAIGEAAPVIVVGVATFIAFDPSPLEEGYSLLPTQIYTWTSRPQDAFREAAAAGIIVLLATLVLLNGVAILLRNQLSRTR